MTTLYWLRNDLRLHDNEALHRSINTNQPLLMVYCFDPRHFKVLKIGFRKTGYLRFKFLRETLETLRSNCNQLGSNLLIRFGKPEEILPTLVKEHNVSELYYQEEIASEETEVEEKLKDALNSTDCKITSIWGKTLYHVADAPFSPDQTPLTSKSFRLKLTKNSEVRPLYETPKSLPTPPKINDWGECPSPQKLGFSGEEVSDITAPFQGGENEGLSRLQYYTFDTELLTSYRWTRNRSLGMDYSSKLSPWMALGALSPRKIYWEVKKYEQEVKRNISTWWLVFEIIWRDYFKFLAMRYGNKMFYSGGIKGRTVDWLHDPILFEKWKTGMTGIPFVDAHMRQLANTGFMSNRGRVNCASFLTRDYQIDWRWGAAWLESTLLDYDVCSNWLNWNTQATEIYYTNPVHQGWKYDRKGDFVRNYLPELIDVPGPIIQAPWLLSKIEKEQYNVKDYPPPAAIYPKWTRALNKITKEHLSN